MESELRSAINKLKDNKSAGRDNLFTEEIKHLGDKGTKMLLDLYNRIWKTGRWIGDWKESVLILLHKKRSIRICGNYRTVVLISHAKSSFM